MATNNDDIGAEIDKIVEEQNSSERSPTNSIRYSKKLTNKDKKKGRTPKHQKKCRSKSEETPTESSKTGYSLRSDKNTNPLKDKKKINRKLIHCDSSPDIRQFIEVQNKLTNFDEEVSFRDESVFKGLQDKRVKKLSASVNALTNLESDDARSQSKDQKQSSMLNNGRLASLSQLASTAQQRSSQADSLTDSEGSTTLTMIPRR